VIKTWKEKTGLTVRDGYGQSETTALIANVRNLPVRPGSMGKVMPGYQMDVVNDAGERLPEGETGNIAVRTDPRPVGLFLEYLDSPEQTQAVFRNGYYYTGDRGARDADGYFWFESRADDVITSSAYRIGPFEVESALIEHPAVVEAAVVGKDDAVRTQIVCAFVILARQYQGSEELAKELQEYVKRETAPYKYPREIHFVSELPKTISGKIRRSELRRWLREGYGKQS
jgi:acyl-coenzyme A synthetase/AMP-(fatty) acid ligase